MNGRTFSLILASAEKEKKNDQQERKLRPAGPCTDVDVADFFPVGGRQVDEEAEGGRLSVVVEGGDQQLVALHCPVRVCTHTVSHHALSTLHRPVRVCTHTLYPIKLCPPFTALYESPHTQYPIMLCPPFTALYESAHTQYPIMLCPTFTGSRLSDIC